MEELQLAIQQLIRNPNIQKFKETSASISACYEKGHSLVGNEALSTYLFVRMPATYAALKSVLSQIPPPISLLDIGSGPATLWWAAHALWEHNPNITAIERDFKFIELGQKLGASVKWVQGDALSFHSFEPHEWVTFSYSLGEFAEKSLKPLLVKCWQAATKGLIIVEPGTPRGYQRILTARNILIEQGGSIFAPCAHSSNCPLQGSDWCHFSVRLQRSQLHKQIKQGSLGYEDEKFSYLIVSKEKFSQRLSRVINHPSRHSGHVVLSLCTPTGVIQKTTVARSQKESYRIAKKLQWGDLF